MTISTTVRTAGPYVGTGTNTGPFGFGFKIFQDSDLLVTVTDFATQVQVATLALGSDYTVSLNADQNVSPGGSIVLTAPLASGLTLGMTSNVPLTQGLSIPNLSGFYPRAIEDALDKVIVLLQQQGAVGTRQTIRVPEIGGISTLASAALRANTQLLFDSQGNPYTAAPVSGSAADVMLALADPVTSGKGPSLVAWLRAATSAVATNLKSWMGWQELSPFEFMTTAQIADCQASGMTLDLAVPLQAWINACATYGLAGRFPKGLARVGTPLTVPAGVTLRGHGTLSRIASWGCDVFTVTGSLVTIADMALFNMSAGGAADPRTNVGINCAGTNGAHIDSFTGRNLYLQGFSKPVKWAYTWTSVLDNVRTINCDYPLYIFGQSVNNAVSNSFLTANGGQSSIKTVMDGVIQGEGLLVTNCLLSSGQYAWDTDGWLSVGFSNCIVDLIGNIAFNNAGYTSGFTVDCPWVYSANRCFHFGDLGAPNDTDASIKVGIATTTGADSLLVWGVNNQGLTMTGGKVSKPAAGGNPILINGPDVSISTLRIRNGSGNPAVIVNAADVHIGGLSGDTYVQWNVSPVKSAASAATLLLPVPNQDGQVQGVTVTGNVNITNGMNDAMQWAGKTVVLKFSGTLNVSDAGTLKLSSGFAATPDDTLTLWSDGTAFYEMARSNN